MDDSLGMDDLWVMEDKTSMSDRGAAIIATTTVFLFLALATTAARFYSVYLSSARFKVEDWLILLGLVRDSRRRRSGRRETNMLVGSALQSLQLA